MASGPSLERGRRWRKIFDTREAAEEYVREERRIRATLNIDTVIKGEKASTQIQEPFEVLKAHGKTVEEAVQFYLQHLDQRDSELGGRTQSRNRESEKSRISEGARTSPFWGLRLVAMLVLIGAAFALDNAIKSRTNLVDNNRTLNDSFESNPLLSGWTSSGPGVNWTAEEHVSGSRSVLVKSGKLSSALLSAKPMQWYRLSFQSKAPGIVANVGSNGYGYCSVLFYDEAGNQLAPDFYSSILQSDGWRPNEFRFRAYSPLSAGGVPLKSKMRINFETIGEQPFFVDDVNVEPVGTPEVADWSDGLYEKLPAKIEYRPKSD